jgi:LysM repeat protein
MAAIAIGFGVLVLAQSATVDAAVKQHTVGPGHSLWKIAKRYHVTVEAICIKNGIEEDDPIKPGQVLLIPEPGEKPQPPPKVAADKNADKGKSSSEKKDDPERQKHWSMRQPDASTQTQKTVAERGGVNPCLSPDPGWGVYDHWSRAPSVGQMIAPQKGGISAGRFDLMVHFHGHEPVRKEWVRVMNGPVLVGIDLGIGSGPYEAMFRSEAAFDKLIESVEQEVARRHGLKRAKVRKLGLSGWSAGYGAVGEILRHKKFLYRVDSVVLLDGLHAGYEGDSLNELQLAPFVTFAREARAGRKFMFASHSSIIPPGYASTTETVNYLIFQLGGRPRSARPRSSDPWGLDLISRYDVGNFHARGFRGNDKMDHCAHIGLYTDVLKVHIKNRWNSPRGYAK